MQHSELDGSKYCLNLPCSLFQDHGPSQISSGFNTMAMWGYHIQRVKIVINDNIIEQVTDFKYLGYLLTYLLTPWSRVLLEKLTSKLCS